MQPPLASRVSASLGARPGGILAEHTRRAHGDTDPQRHWCHGHPNVTTVRHQPLSHRERGMCCVGRTRERAVDNHMASHHTHLVMATPRFARITWYAAVVGAWACRQGWWCSTPTGYCGYVRHHSPPRCPSDEQGRGVDIMHTCMLATETSPKPHGQITPFLLLALQLNLRSSTCEANVVRRTRFALGWTYCHACH
jgi:hypothetical protein